MSVSAHRKIFNSEIPPTGYGVVRILVVLVVLFFSSFGVVGQNGVTISSPELNPTDANPIPIDIHFEGPVNRNLAKENFVVTNGEIGNFERGIPEYENLNSSDINDFPVVANPSDFFASGYTNLLSEEQRMAYLSGKISKSVISIDVDSVGNIYYLTFADGVYLYLENEEDENIIDGDEFEAPLDMVIDNNDRIIVADPENLRVRIYNSDGTHDYDIGGSFGSGSGDFYGPTGLAVNDANILYVADQYSGQYEGENVDLVKLYNLNSTSEDFIRQFGFDILNDPYRIAVDGSNNVFVSDSEDSGRVLVFNDQDDHVDTLLSGSGNSPGSIITDDFGYVYIINYNGNLTFSDIYLNPLILINNYEEIQNGDYQVDVYSPFPNLDLVTTFSENLDLPIDLALNHCNNIFVNDLELGGQAKSIIDIQANFDFDLEKFQRNDNFTAEVIPDNPGLVQVFLEDADLFKCGPQPEGAFSIVYQPQLPAISCKTTALYLDANGAAVLDPVDIFDGDATASNIDRLEVDRENYTCSDLGSQPVELKVFYTNGTSAVCTTQITVVDEIDPIAVCIAPGKEFTLVNGSVTIDPEDIDNGSNDNCSFKLSVTPSTFTTTGTKTVTLKVADPSGRIDECNTTIEVVNPSPPAISCKTTALFLGANGAGVLDPVYIFDGDATASNIDRLEVDQENYTCSDLGSQPVELKVFYTNGTSAVCTTQITVVDEIDPTAVCIAPGKEFTLVNGSVTIDPEDIDNGSDDNCSFTLSVTPSTFTTTGTKTVTLKVTDPSGRIDECSTTIKVVNPTPPPIECKPTTLNLDENGTVVLDPAEIFDGDASASNIEKLEASKTVFGCSDIGSSQTVTLTVLYRDGTSDNCDAQVTVLDEIDPIAVCIAPGKEFTLVNGSVTIDPEDIDNGSDDNCSFTLSVTPSTFTTTGTKTVTLKVTDPSGRIDECSTTIQVVHPTQPPIACKPTILNLDANGTAVLNPADIFDGDANASGIDELQVDKTSFSCEDVGVPQSVVLTVHYSDGTSNSCTTQVTVLDNQHPKFTCISEQNITFDPEVGYTLPDYREEANPSDNCAFVWVQTPAPNTVLYTSRAIEISATDGAGNQTWCSFIVRLTEEEPDELQISCPENQSAQLNANCEFLVPDYTSMANVNISDAVVTQNPPAGTTLNSNTSISLIATAGNQSVTCVFQLILQDNTAPTVVCPPDQWENYDPANDFALPDYRVLAVTSDACGIAQIQQSPSPGTHITQNTTVSLAVTDQSGNSITCAFMVNLTEDDVLQISCPEDQVVQPSENCSFALPDYTELAEVNFNGVQVTQAPSPGSQISGNTTVILTASFNGQTDSCAFDVYSEDNTAPVANCIATGGYRLDQNGNVALTPEQINNGSTDNCGIVSMELNRTNFTTADIGDHTIRLTVKDAAGSTDSCETTISIWPYVGTGNEFTCKTNFILELDETGNATLSPEDLYTGDPQDRQFSLNKTEFSCENIGENNVILSYTGTAGTSSCDVIVQVKDSRAPTIIARNITVTLDSQNQAIITPQMVDNGTSDNCSFTLSLDQTVFGCKDLGEKTITLTGTDSSGNSASATAVVTVIGVCDDPPIPVEGVDHIFIYPNPTPGPFKFATPTGMTIDRVEAFDARGRFIVAKTFDENLREYQMDLTGVEQAVYFLKIFSSDGAKILRVIIK